MNVFLLACAILLLLVGLAGCILPGLPGPPLSFLGLWLLHLAGIGSPGTGVLVVLAMLVATVSMLDVVAPPWMTRRFGGSRKGIFGAAAGLLVGILFFPPLGIVIGPLIGAVAGELLHGSESRQALKAGLGSFAGFFLGMGLKLVVTLVIAYFFVKALL